MASSASPAHFNPLATQSSSPATRQAHPFVKEEMLLQSPFSALRSPHMAPFVILRLLPLFLYYLSSAYSSLTSSANANFTISIALTTIALCVDFWWCKNVAGRRLAGLRWWTRCGPSSTILLSFECSKSHLQTMANVSEASKKCFWWTLYGVSAVWGVTVLAAAVGLEAGKWVTVLSIAAVLNAINASAFHQASIYALSASSSH